MIKILDVTPKGETTFKTYRFMWDFFGLGKSLGYFKSFEDFRRKLPQPLKKMVVKVKTEKLKYRGATIKLMYFDEPSTSSIGKDKEDKSESVKE